MINDRFIRCNFTEIAFLSGKGDKVYGENGTRVRWSNIVVVVRGGKERKEMCDWEKGIGGTFAVWVHWEGLFSPIMLIFNPNLIMA